MDCIIHGVTKSQTWLSNFYFYLFSYAVFGYLELHSIYFIIIITFTIIITMLYQFASYEPWYLDFEHQTSFHPQMNLIYFRRIRGIHPGGVLEMNFWRYTYVLIFVHEALELWSVMQAYLSHLPCTYQQSDLEQVTSSSAWLPRFILALRFYE